MDASDRRILFVDDDPQVRTLFASAMTPLGFQVDLAVSGIQALRLIAARQYPVVATDLHMPGLDGLGLIQGVAEKAPGTVFVVVTGYPNLLSLYGSPTLERYIYSLVTKPWDNAELAAALDQALDVHQARESVLSRAEEGGGKPLLLIEERDEDARVLTLLLEDTDFANRPVEHVNSLAAALPRVGGDDFDLILTALSLPDARGLDAVQRLSTTAPHTALMIVSSFWDEVLAMRSLEMGVQDFLVKSRLDAGHLNRAIHYALKRKKSEESLARQAYSDALTGLLSTRAFEGRLRHALAVARRHRRRLALMVMDLDGLGEINERLGFSAGNAVLRHFSRRLAQTMRDTDSLSRLDGSQFAVLLEDVDPTALGIVTERILRATTEPLSLAGSRVSLNWSVGVAVYPESGEHHQDLLDAAQASLQAGKRRGVEGCSVEVRM